MSKSKLAQSIRNVAAEVLQSVSAIERFIRAYTYVENAFNSSMIGSIETAIFCKSCSEKRRIRIHRSDVLTDPILYYSSPIARSALEGFAIFIHGIPLQVDP